MPPPISSLSDLMQDILLRILIVASEVLHQFLDSRVHRHEELDMVIVVPAMENSVVLPGRGGRLEDVDFAVFLGNFLFALAL
jgi:hypothetical protein